jgi:hypothetical protein
MVERILQFGYGTGVPPFVFKTELLRCLSREGCRVHRIFSDIDERHRYFLLVLTDFGTAVCSAKLIVHLLGRF